MRRSDVSIVVVIFPVTALMLRFQITRYGKSRAAANLAGATEGTASKNLADRQMHTGSCGFLHVG